MQTPRRLLLAASLKIVSVLFAPCVWACITLAPNTQALAQSAPERPQLTGPALKKPAPPCHWKVTFHPAIPGTPVHPSVPLSYSVLKTPRFTVITFQMRDGTARESWTVGSHYFESSPGSDRVEKTGQDPDSSWADFSELSWLSPQAFRGAFAIQGQPYLAFAENDEIFAPAKAPKAGEAGAGKPKTPTQARPTPAATKWPAGPIGGIPLNPSIRAVAVDEKNRFPKYLQESSFIREYEIQPAPNAEAELPAKIRNLLKPGTP
ncbi:MAG: hypothetical protein RLZZ399_199 [Verrucomicrobiota bacterium]